MGQQTQKPKPKVQAPAKPAPKPAPRKPLSTADAIKNTRARQMQELGLRNGGKVKRK